MPSKIAPCKRCGKIKKIRALGLCPHCYGYYGDPEHLKECPVCKKMKPLHARGICHNCYHKKYRYNIIKGNNTRRRYAGLSYENWLLITKECIVCGFDKCVDMHHIDKNKKNQSPSNLVGLCPNHHKMIHMDKYHEEIEGIIREKRSKD